MHFYHTDLQEATIYRVVTTTGGSITAQTPVPAVQRVLVKRSYDEKQFSIPATMSWPEFDLPFFVGLHFIDKPPHGP